MQRSIAHRGRRGLTEAGLVRWLRELPLAAPGGVALAVGDDAAAWRPAPGELQLATCDMLVEGTDFLRAGCRPRRLGRKLASVNLSDLAAMGGRPRQALLALALEPGCPSAFARELVRGVREQLAEHGANLLGGDLSGIDGPRVLSLTLLGSVARARMLRRDGARPGDRLCVTGWLGEAAAGLLIAGQGLRLARATRVRLERALEQPRAHVEEGIWLARRGGVGAAMDVSDGLALDLSRLLEASGVGATIEAAALPISEPLREAARALGRDPERLALGGGEEFCLLLAVPERRWRSLAEAFAIRFGRCLTPIGRVERRRGMRLSAGGRVRRLAALGYQHFAG